MKKISFILLFLVSFSSYSQNYLGVGSSNYAGATGMYTQPASFVDGRVKFDLNLVSTNFSAYQNFGAFDASVLPKWWKGSFEDQDALDAWSVDADSTLEGNMTADKTLDASKIWLLKGRVSVESGATLTIPVFG